MSNANLMGADLTAATLNRANLSNANLTRADMTEAILTGTNLSNANLTLANLKGACLIDANWAGATIKGVDLSIAVDRSVADLPNAIRMRAVAPVDTSGRGLLAACAIQ